MIKLIRADCLNYLKKIESRSIDLIFTDPPYGTTKCKWDEVVSFTLMWAQLKRIRKENTPILLFGGEPFSSFLRISNIDEYRYDWIWNKKKAANFLFANKQPLKKTENISVFYKKQPKYFPIKIPNPNGPQKAGRVGIGNLIKEHLPNCPKRSRAGMNYEPSKLLPDNILEFSKPHRPIHPTQKPIELLEYLIKTYSEPGDVILDFTMGSGSTGVACKNLKRKFIGIEKEKKYFEIAKQRILKGKKS